MRALLSVLALVLSLCACTPSRPGPRSLTVTGDAEFRIDPDRVILSERPPEPRTIIVTGDAEVRVVPDEVILTLGVENWSKDLDAAKRKNDEIVQGILAVAGRYGVEPRHVQTDHVSIEPRYEDGYEQRDFIGYFVRKTVVVTLGDVSQFEDLLTSVLEADANYVHGIQFRTTELRKHRDAARALAVKAAREKAVALASELGQEVGQPLTIREEQGSWWSWYNAWWGSRWGAAVSQNVVQNAGPGAYEGDGSLAPGQISVSARVSVEFELQ